MPSRHTLSHEDWMSEERTFARIWRSLIGKRAVAVPPKPAASTPKSGIERRRLPRVRVLSTLHGYEVELDAKVAVQEISTGGFSAESPVEFKPGTEHTFLFSRDDGEETMVRCECRHIRPASRPGSTGYVAGFRFLLNQDENLKILIDLYRRLRQKYPPNTK